MTAIKMHLSSIRIDGGTQPREAIDEATVAEYREAIEAGALLPAVTVFHDGAEHWLADGFHRFHAHRAAGDDSIRVEIHEGTRRDAVLYSVGANGSHGLRRSAADKRKAVATLLADPEWSQWSDAEIARQCAVYRALVHQVRSSLANLASEPAGGSSHANFASERTYTTKHGTKSTMQIGNIGSRPADPSGSCDIVPTAPPLAESANERDAQQGRDDNPVQILEDELRRATELVKALEADDAKAALAKEVRLRQGIESRLRQETDKVARMDRDLQKFGKLFRDLRKLTGAETNSAVVEAVRKAFKAAA